MKQFLFVAPEGWNSAKRAQPVDRKIKTACATWIDPALFVALSCLV